MLAIKLLEYEIHSIGDMIRLQQSLISVLSNPPELADPEVYAMVKDATVSYMESLKKIKTHFDEKQ